MKQDNSNEILNDVTTNDYKYGFVTDIETEVIPTGLCENVIRLISQKKGEPEYYPPYFGEEKGAGMVT